MLNKTIRRDMFPNMTWVASETCGSQSGLAPFANKNRQLALLESFSQEDGFHCFARGRMQSHEQ
jgi:hypothetical protein